MILKTKFKLYHYAAVLECGAMGVQVSIQLQRERNGLMGGVLAMWEEFVSRTSSEYVN